MSGNLDLGLIGNCGIAALVDAAGEIVWSCMPRADGDPVFCSLLRARRAEGDFGFFAVELSDLARSEQQYLDNTPILVTRLTDRRGGAIEITDFAPRFLQFGRMFCPVTLVRQVRCLTGSPRVTVRLRPAGGYGAAPARVTFGSNHVRYECADFALRATTNCSITALLEEIPFVLQGTVTFVLGPDETLQGSVLDIARRFLEETTDYWRDWVRDLSIPSEWQEEILRAAIALKLAALDDTGAVLAAFTTSIPEAADSGRNWDYRFCWLRDAYFTVNALNRLNATKTMERYLSYIINVAGGAEDGRLQPVYRISGRREMQEGVVTTLPGYRHMGPVRVGNEAYRQVQNDVYGSAILAATHAFFDSRLLRPGNEGLFEQLEALGEQAARVWATPDAGLWELRNASRVHTSSSIMCWAACDRLAKIAARLGLPERARYWRKHAEAIHRGVCERAWSPSRGSFVSTFGGNDLDASLLLLV
ncbi:MAG: glycoside hydrolase family 15 protein, partial [Burkholderiales bacterium]